MGRKRKHFDLPTQAAAGRSGPGPAAACYETSLSIALWPSKGGGTRQIADLYDNPDYLERVRLYEGSNFEERPLSYRGIETDAGVLLFNCTLRGESLYDDYLRFLADHLNHPCMELTYVRTLELLPDETLRSKVNPPVDVLGSGSMEMLGRRPSVYHAEWDQLGIYTELRRFDLTPKETVNADLIEKDLRTKGRLSFNDFSIIVSEEELKTGFQASGLFAKTGHGQQLLDTLKVHLNVLNIPDPALIDSYFAAFVAEFLRLKMLNVVETFTIETVMSDSRKLDYIQLAKSMGYRIYLYFVSTKDVTINIDRGRFRVEVGGHDVPEEKIRKRYEGSLRNLRRAIQLADRAYFFDNSITDEYVKTFFAEYDGSKHQIHFRADHYPWWFEKYAIGQ